MLIKRVLTLTDGSSISRNAMKYAVEICNQFGAELYLLTVIEKAPSFVTAELSQHFFEQAETALRKEVQSCSGYCETSGLKCRGEVRSGVVFEEIVAYAEEMDADLIVMSTHGRSGLSHVLLGSVAERVVRRAPCPVMTIRPTAKDWQISNQGTCEI